jgi:RNA polymerase sigma factor (sigma-70 family)
MNTYDNENISFEKLVRKISPVLKRITYKLNGHFSFFNHDDLFQEALMHLWLNYQDGKLNDKTDSYILQGCFYHLKNYIRKIKNKVNVVSMEALVNEAGADLESIVSLEAPEECFEHLDKNILNDRLNDFGLTEREKDVLFLSMDGYTVREIGIRLGISHVMVVKIKNKIQLKCEKLKEEIKQSYQNQ